MKLILFTCFTAIIWSTINIQDVQSEENHNIHPNCQDQTIELDEKCPRENNRGCLSKTVLSTTLEDLRGVFVAMIDRLNIQIEGKYEPRPAPCKWPQNCRPKLPGFESGCNAGPCKHSTTTREPTTTTHEPTTTTDEPSTTTDEPSPTTEKPTTDSA